MPFNWRKHYAIKKRFDTEFNWLTEEPGIYLWTREENGITYFYVGQAKNLKNRRFNYYCIECGLSYPTRHFEASLKKHKDWEFEVLDTCAIEELDEREKYWIDHYNALPNHITRNDLIANQDIVRSNAKRIHNVYTKYENNIKKMLKHLGINLGLGRHLIKIYPLVNKNGEWNKQSKKAFEEFKTWLQQLRLQNYIESPTPEISEEDQKHIIESKERELLNDVKGDFENEI